MHIKNVVLGVVVVSTGLAAAIACAQSQTVAPKPAARVESFAATTDVWFDVKKTTVTPQIGLVSPGDKVQFHVQGLASGQTLEIDFRVQGAPKAVKGPFKRAQTQTQTQTQRGRYTFAADGPTTTGPVEAPRGTAWKYDVVVREKGDTEDVWLVDPMIVVAE
jgi:hypothetical protein